MVAGQKRTKKLAVCAASVVVAGALCAWAVALSQSEVQFDPGQFIANYNRGTMQSQQGYQANPVEADAQANRHDENSENNEESTQADGPSNDAFSDAAAESPSGTTAYNVIDGAQGSVNLVNGNASADSAATPTGPIANDSAGSGDNAGNVDNSGGSNGGNTGGSDNSDIVPDIDPTPNSYKVLPSDPASSKTNDGLDGSGIVFIPVGSDGGALSGVEPDALSVNILESTTSPLYNGQKLDAWTIFCSLVTTFGYGENVYQWTCTQDQFASYPYFRIVSWKAADGAENPETCPNSTLEITVEYRCNTSTEFKSETVAVAPKESCAFVVSDASDLSGSLSVIDKCLDSVVNLLSYKTQGALLESTGRIREDGTLSELLLGWKEGVSDVDWFYSLTAGRHVIEPSSFAKLDDGYKVYMQSYNLTSDYSIGTVEEELCSLQTLTDTDDDVYEFTTNADGSLATLKLVVPEGIQAIDDRKQDSESRLALVILSDMEIPSSVFYVNANGPYQVESSYSVDEANPVYASTAQGILTSKDGTRYLGIPTSMTEVDVPSSVELVEIPIANRIETLRIHGNDGTPPQVDVEKLSDATIVVDDGLFDDFVMQNYAALERASFVSVAKASNPEATYICSGGMIYSEEELVAAFNVGVDTAFLQLPHTVKSGAFDGASDFTSIVLFDDGDFVFEDGSLSNSAISTIVCITEEQYDYVRSRLAAAGAPDSCVEMAMVSQEEYFYYVDSKTGKVTLLSDQGFASGTFDGTLTTEDGETLEVNTISSYAFSGDTELQWVNLAQSVTEIGAGAFKNCSSLQGVFISASGTVAVGAQALDGCESLGFVACRAKEGNFADQGDVGDSCVWYSLESVTSGYNSSFVYITGVSDFMALPQEDGSLVLYGAFSSDGDAASAVPRIALAGGTSYCGTLVIPSTVYEIFDNAFSGMRGNFNVDWACAESLGYIDSRAFKDSGYSGDLVIDVLEHAEKSLQIQKSAFENCTQITSLTLNAENIEVDNYAFSGCTSIESASINASLGGRLGTGVFTGANKLTSVSLGGSDPLSLTMLSPGVAFSFNGEWDADEEADRLSLDVPESLKQQYLEAWIYPFVGYDGYDSYYSAVFDALYFDNLWNRPDNPIPTEAEVREKMAENLLAPENRLRRMMGMPQVDSSTIVKNDSVEVNGCVFSVNDAGATLVSVSSDATSLDLDELIPGEYENVKLGAGAFSECAGLRSIIIGSKVGSIENGAFAGLGGVQVVLPASGAPALEGSTTDSPFSFGGEIALVVPDGAQNAYLEAWAMGCLGFADVAAFEDHVLFDIYFEHAFDELDEAGWDELVNAPLMEQENYLRSLMGLSPIESTAELAYRYDVSAFVFDW